MGFKEPCLTVQQNLVRADRRDEIFLSNISKTFLTMRINFLTFIRGEKGSIELG